MLTHDKAELGEVLRHADVRCRVGEVLRHAGVGRVLVETRSWRGGGGKDSAGQVLAVVGVSVEIFKVFSLDKVLQRLVQQIMVVDWVQQRFVEQNFESGVRLVAPFAAPGRARAILTWKLDIISSSSSSGRHSPSCSCDSLQMLL